MLSGPKHAPKSYPLALYMRATYLRESIESLLQQHDFKYGVRFDNSKGATEFTYCWQIMLAKN